MLLQVELHGVVVGNQGTAATKWPQPHIHPKTEALRSLGVEELDHRLPYPDKELLITDGFLFPSGRTCLGVKKYKIDIGGQIELTTAKLPHAEYNQLLRRLRPLAHWVAVAALPVGRRPTHRVTNRGIGKVRESRQCLIKICDT